MLKFTPECKHFIDLLPANYIFTNMGNLHLSGMMSDTLFKNMKKLLKNKFFIERQPVRKILSKKKLLSVFYKFLEIFESGNLDFTCNE